MQGTGCRDLQNSVSMVPSRFAARGWSPANDDNSKAQLNCTAYRAPLGAFVVSLHDQKDKKVPARQVMRRWFAYPDRRTLLRHEAE